MILRTKELMARTKETMLKVNFSNHNTCSCPTLFKPFKNHCYRIIFNRIENHIKIGDGAVEDKIVDCDGDLEDQRVDGKGKSVDVKGESLKTHHSEFVPSRFSENFSKLLKCVFLKI